MRTDAIYAHVLLPMPMLVTLAFARVCARAHTCFIILSDVPLADEGHAPLMAVLYITLLSTCSEQAATTIVPCFTGTPGRAHRGVPGRVAHNQLESCAGKAVD